MTLYRSRAGSTVREATLSDAELPPLDLSIRPWPGRLMTVGGGELFVRETPGGDGAEPAVYVHGLGGASTNWTDLSAQLAPWLAGLAPDLPGFGRSGPARRYTLDAHAGAVIGLIERTGRGPVHLLGNSMGGAISIAVAAARPDLIRTLTLISPAVPALRPSRRRGDPFLPLIAVPGLGALLLRYVDRMTPEQRARNMLAFCFADPSRVPEHRLAQAAEEIRARAGQRWAGAAFAGSLRGLIASYLVPGARGLWARLAAITAPTLVVWGAQDRLVDPALAPRVAAAIRDARLLMIDGAGHVAQMEQPVLVARAVVGLLEDTARDTAR